MTDVILVRAFDPPLTEERVLAMADESGECFDLHKVDWQRSFLSSDGQRMICWFRGPDAESARIALRQVGADIATLSPVTVHVARQAAEADLAAAHVIVERRFDRSVTAGEIEAMEEAGARSLETHRVTLVRTFVSSDAKLMICFYRAPDVESARLAHLEAGMPLDRVWAFHAVLPPGAA